MRGVIDLATYDAGVVTAYGSAVQGGYTGTYEQFCAQQANYAASAAAVEQAAQSIADIGMEVYVDGTSLVINTAITDGNEVSY